MLHIANSRPVMVKLGNSVDLESGYPAYSHCLLEVMFVCLSADIAPVHAFCRSFLPFI